MAGASPENRPIAPHLQIWRWHVTMASSILHRLSGIGLYGVVSYSVAQRTRELGIRMALGAQRSEVLRMIVGEGMMLAGLGIAAGLAGALAVGRLPTGLLYGVAPNDPITFALVASMLGAVTLLASYLPASRATRINPAGVLGAEA